MGWLTGWSYRRQVLVGGVQGAGTDYVVRLVLAEGIVTDGSPVHLSLFGQSSVFPSAKNDSGDVRVTTSDGTTLCPLWVERVTGASPYRVATLWIKVPVSLDTDQVLFVYYGNAQATNVSDGNSVFLLYDDFNGSVLDTNKWAFTRTGGTGSYTITIENSLAKIWSGAYTAACLSALTSFSMPLRGIGSWQFSFPSGADASFAFAPTSSNDTDWIRACYGPSAFLYQKRISGDIVTIQQVTRTPPSSQVRFVFSVGNNYGAYVENGVQINTITTQDRFTDAYLYPEFTNWNNGNVWVDYIAVTKAIPQSRELIPVKISNSVETQDGAPLIQRSYPELSEVGIAWSAYFGSGPALRVGNGVILGTVRRLGVPARRRVTLLDRQSMRPIQTVWSDADGNYRFDNVDRNFRYLVICDDYAQEYNAAVADWVEPE